MRPVRYVLFLPSYFFFPCKTRSSTHLLNHPSRFPPSTTTCRVRPWLVPKVSVISTIRLVLLRLFFSSLSLSSSSCPIVAWVGVSPSNLSSPLYSQLNDKMTKWRCFCCCSLDVCVRFHVRDECWHVFLRLLPSVTSEVVERNGWNRVYFRATLIYRSREGQQFPRFPVPYNATGIAELFSRREHRWRCHTPCSQGKKQPTNVGLALDVQHSHIMQTHLACAVKSKVCQPNPTTLPLSLLRA
jgi:hypothetical protein